MHRRAALPCLTELSYSTGMEPGFQTVVLKQVTNSAQLSHAHTPELLETHHEGLLLIHRLETSVTELGGGVDELEVDLLLSTTARLHQQGLAQGQYPLLGSDHTAFQHQEVVGHLTVMDKSTLRREIKVSMVQDSLMHSMNINLYAYCFIQKKKKKHQLPLVAE